MERQRVFSWWKLFRVVCSMEHFHPEVIDRSCLGCRVVNFDDKHFYITHLYSAVKLSAANWINRPGTRLSGMNVFSFSWNLETLQWTSRICWRYGSLCCLRNHVSMLPIILILSRGELVDLSRCVWGCFYVHTRHCKLCSGLYSGSFGVSLVSFCHVVHHHHRVCQLKLTFNLGSIW